MLITQGDLIPVEAEATSVPWTRRKSQILNHLHRGPVDFSTLVYDTNVGDISAISTYFNPERISVQDLNSRFGQYPSSIQDGSSEKKDSTKPRLLLYPEHNPNQIKAQRTLKWVLSHNDNEEDGGQATLHSTTTLSNSPIPELTATHTLPDHWHAASARNEDSCSPVDNASSQFQDKRLWNISGIDMKSVWS